MINWDDFRFFLQLAKDNKLKSTAEVLKVDQATVGRRIQNLEENLNTRLFDKTSQGFYLTDSGRVIFETIEKIDLQFLSVERMTFGKNNLIQGSIKIAMPGALANHFIIPNLKTFIQSYPEIELQFLTGPEVLNLSKREADLAIRLVRPQQKDLIIKKIGQISLNLVAHNQWIAKMQKTGKDISSWPFIGLYDYAKSELEQKLLTQLAFIPKYKIRSAAWSSVYSAINAQLGMGILPSFMMKNNKELQSIFENETLSRSTPIWLVVHPDVYTNLKVKLLIDHLLEQCKNL